MKRPPLSPTSLRRFPKYRAVAQALVDQGWDYITSGDIARACDMQEILVRKDLAQTGVVGRRRCGYPLKELVRALTNTIGWNQHHRIVVMGAGRLAEALVELPAFAKCNISFSFAADPNPAKVGGELCGIPIISDEEAYRRLAKDPIRLAILTVPTEVAQAVSDRLVKVGVRAIMNFTAVTLTVPDGVEVVEADVLPYLAVLSHALKDANARAAPDEVRPAAAGGAKAKRLRRSPDRKAVRK